MNKPVSKRAAKALDRFISDYGRVKELDRRYWRLWRHIWALKGEAPAGELAEALRQLEADIKAFELSVRLPLGIPWHDIPRGAIRTYLRSKRMCDPLAYHLFAAIEESEP